MSAPEARLALVALGDAEGVLTARRVARDAAAALGFGGQDQTRIATAVSELARNAHEHARGGRLIVTLSEPGHDRLVCRVEDDGPGIIDVDRLLAARAGSARGLLGVRRLVEDFEITSTPSGTRASFSKALPARVPVEVAPLRQRLQRRVAADAQEELEVQNKELLHALTALRARQEELLALNRELDDTNRGVVALHRELDEQAERDRTVSRMLQRSLMPELLSVPPGFSVEAAHRSAGEGALVGGDFYDVIDLGAEELWLFMGDVAGHGVETAAKANELRQSLRVYVREGYEPSAAFDRLNQIVLADDLVGLASACLVRMRRAAHEADVLVAGHPAPLLLPPGGAPRLLGDGAGPILGIPGLRWATTTHPFAPGTRIVLYTDGLIERVGETLDAGYARLLRLGRELDPDGPAALAQLFALLPPGELRDDVALLIGAVD